MYNSIVVFCFKATVFIIVVVVSLLRFSSGNKHDSREYTQISSPSLNSKMAIIDVSRGPVQLNVCSSAPFLFEFYFTIANVDFKTENENRGKKYSAINETEINSMSAVICAKWTTTKKKVFNSIFQVSYMLTSTHTTSINAMSLK